jgi:hypothetical protein
LAHCATNAGVYAPSGLYSNQQGYIINYVNGTLTVNKANLTLSGLRIYDGTKVVPGSVLTASGVAGQTFAINGSGGASNLTSKNVQTGSTLASLIGLTLGASNNGGISTNYNALNLVGSSFSITPAALTINAVTDSKTYDGTTSSTGVATYTGLQAGDSLTGLSQAFTSANVLGTLGSTLNVSGYTLNDGNSGGNYTITSNIATGTISSNTAADTITPITTNEIVTTSIEKVTAVVVGTTTQSGQPSTDKSSDAPATSPTPKEDKKNKQCTK